MKVSTHARHKPAVSSEPLTHAAPGALRRSGEALPRGTVSAQPLQHKCCKARLAPRAGAERGDEKLPPRPRAGGRAQVGRFAVQEPEAAEGVKPSFL